MAELDDNPFHHLGLVHQRAGRLQDAVECYGQALARDPACAETHNNLAIALKGLGRPEEALASFELARQTLPDSPEILNNIGNLQKQTGCIDEAIDAYEQAIALRPDFADALNNLAGALLDAGRVRAAIDCFDRALAASPSHAVAASGRLYAMHFLDDADSRSLSEPHRDWGWRYADTLTDSAEPHSNSRDPSRRIRVGYVSPNFYEHSVGRFLLPLLAHHDKSAVEVFAYSDVNRPDQLTQTLRSHVDVWHGTFGLSDEGLAQLVRTDEIDVLVDLNMHMADSRLLVFARRPAPVQVTYLAYCGTTGMRAMDYRFTDQWLDPPTGDDGVYTEESIRLRGSWCYSVPKEEALTPLRAKTPKPGAVTFGCLNNFCKVSDAALLAWSEILNRLPESRLILHAHAGRHRSRVLDAFAARGIDPARIAFQRFVPFHEYLASYSRIDVGLDSLPCSGGTTTCDALWMGVPVVSLAGGTAVSRGGLSILSTLGLAELVAFDIDTYVEKAVALGQDSQRLLQLQSTLRKRLLASPLMDGVGFTHDVEAAYRRMWQTWCERAGGSK